MTQRIAGPGLPLPLPQNLYPTELGGANLDFGSNRLTLPPGAAVPVPAGEWLVSLGMYLFLQYLDPITNTWITSASGGWEGPHIYVFSDGYNVRIANMLGCPIDGVVTAPGTGYVQASTTIAVTGGGGSTWQPIIGGQLAVIGGTLVSSGAGYGIAPLAIIPQPPPAASNPNGVGGVPADGYFTIASGTISGFTFTNPGAGYPAGLTITAYASPYDPNLSTGITLGTIAFSLAAGGSLTGVLCTNSGAPIANPANITLTVSGVGSQGTVSPIMVQTITKGSVTGAGTGFGTIGVELTTVGGAPPTSTYTNSPTNLYLAYKPRPAQIGLTGTGSGGTVAAQAGTIYDGGLFYSTPSPIVSAGAQSGSLAGPTVALTMGSVPDIAYLQPAP
jgi:hypothetical protein